MPDNQSLLPALKRAVRTSIQRLHGSRQRDVALVWRGYIEALRENQILSDDEHAAVADLLPELADDPLAEGWKAAGWLASFAEPPDAGDVETLDLKTVAMVRRSAAG
jgi:hypothetical protein